MLSSNVPVLKAVALFMCVGQYTLCLRCQRQLYARGNLFSEECAAFYLFANGLDGDLRARKEPTGQSLILTHEPQQQMLWLNGRCAELAGFVACKEDYPARFLCVAFKHWALYRRRTFCMIAYGEIRLADRTA